MRRRPSGDVVNLWNIDPKHWQQQARRIANRNFSRDEWIRYIGYGELDLQADTR